MIAKKIVIIIFISINIVACGSFQVGTEAGYNKQLEKYIGQKIDTVVNELGYADSTSEAPNGNKLFVYSMLYTYTTPVNCSAYFHGIQNCTGGDSSVHWCKTFFEVNNMNTVIQFSYKGNACSKCESDDALFCF